jgi:hypothetical protein
MQSATNVSYLHVKSGALDRHIISDDMISLRIFALLHIWVLNAWP